MNQLVCVSQYSTVLRLVNSHLLQWSLPDGITYSDLRCSHAHGDQWVRIQALTLHKSGSHQNIYSLAPRLSIPDFFLQLWIELEHDMVPTVMSRLMHYTTLYHIFPFPKLRDKSGKGSQCNSLSHIRNHTSHWSAWE